MDNQPHGADDLPDLAELSGPLRDAVESLRREEPTPSALQRVLDRARLVPASVASASAEEHAAAGFAPQELRPARRHRMVALAIRATTALAAAAALFGAWLYSHVAPTEAADLGTVLTKTSAAQTLELTLSRDGAIGRAWIGSGRLRWNLPDGTYHIARDGRTWVVDEKANRASSRPSTVFPADTGRVDLVALLGVPLDGKHQDLLAAKPARRTTRDGAAVEIYRWQTEGPDGTIRIDAEVDAKTQLLQSIEALRVRGERTEPICRLAVIARDKPVDEDLFVVGDTLTEDGRIGKVTDVQGLVALRPVMVQRWSPVGERMPIGPGDWIQTDPRGANAVSVRLVPQAEMVIGPGSTVELSSPKRLRIAAGEIKIKAGKSAVELIGPAGEKVSVEGTQIYRADSKLVKLDKEPPWLRSYLGKQAGDSIGSLITKIDGRNVPLSVGYHKVTVDIRDQIARTTIEESFVNHTPAQLEGTFFFPLPQDASIAGFGMWIGDNLVEADIVEKERAREIYETILRERRDPGLLEWAGGNIFKARVFPIFPHAEKRITITYTQVLPLRAATYRYQYALQSELLRQHPLRQLEIDVKVNSAIPLKAVSSPTHLTRNALTAHSAHVEFSAKEYTPTQDFEVVVEVDGRQSDVVLIPHRRGDDGYFMVQLTPPGEGGAGQAAPGTGSQLTREVLPDGEPLELVILADTSASMDAPSRRRQAELVAALLAALTPKDKFNLATCDVDCRWAFAKPAAAEPKNVELARQILAARISLGWTDLDKALAAASAQCGPKTHVVYLGDGIVTTAARGVGGSPANAARSAIAPHPFAGEPPTPRAAGTFHAVAVSSSFEPAVLKAIAAMGGGSVRQVSGSQGPAAVAMELLGEITQPVVRDLKIEFRGLRTARVYPEHLPNLPLGTQHILLGRYAPESKPQAGEIIVTGTQAGKPVRFTAQVSLDQVGRIFNPSQETPNAGRIKNPSYGERDDGNSFIPRLWARMHLDALLEQGSSQAIKDEIIALSEEYHILTPYTSLLVLETDADRERFGVKRRFQMRDGEKFFAEGRENANWELIQQQMKRAGTWRLGLRRDVLQQLSRLGRTVPAAGHARVFSSSGNVWWSGGGGGGFGGGLKANELAAATSYSFADEVDYKVNGMAGVFQKHQSVPLFSEVDVLEELSRESSPGPASRTLAKAQSDVSRLGDDADLRQDLEEGEVELGQTVGKEMMNVPEQARAAGLPGLRTYDVDQGYIDAGGYYDYQPDFGRDAKPEGLGRFSADLDLPVAQGPVALYGRFKSSRENYGRVVQRGLDYSWLNGLFPTLPPPPPAQEPKPSSSWSAEARAIARSLLRTDRLTGVKDGTRVEIEAQAFDTRWNDLTSRSRTLALVAPKAWLTVSESDGSQTRVAWADSKERGEIAKGLLLGRVRPSRPTDLSHPPIDLGTGTMTPLEHAYPNYSVQIKPEGAERTRLVLSRPDSPAYEVRILIDTARHVVLKIETVGKGQVSHTTVCDAFVEVAGSWYAGQIVGMTAEGRRNTITTQRFTALAAGDFQRQFHKELALREQAQLLREPLPRVIDAKKALAAGKAGFEDQLVMLLHFQATQQWDRVLGHLESAEKLAPKPGMRWVRTAALVLARKAEEAKKRCFAEAELSAKAAVARAPQPGTGDDLALADHVLNSAGGILAANEMLRLLDALRPVYASQPPHVLAMKRWGTRRVGLVEQIGQALEMLGQRKQLATDYPHDYDLQQQYARALANVGEYPAAYAWLDRVLVAESKWYSFEEETLRTLYADLLRQQGRYDDVVRYLGEWIQQSSLAGASGFDGPASKPEAQAKEPASKPEAQAKEPASKPEAPAKEPASKPEAPAKEPASKPEAQAKEPASKPEAPARVAVSPNAPSQNGYAQYLSALVWADQFQRAEELIAKWIEDGRRPGELSPDCEARLRAAVSQALGQGHNLYTNRIDERWLAPLAEAATALARHPSAAPVAEQIMSQRNFQQSDECRRVRAAAAKILRTEANQLPVEQINRFISWISPNDPAVEKEAWRQIAAGLRRRWDAEPDWQVRRRLGAILAGVLHRHVGPEEWLGFLRVQLDLERTQGTEGTQRTAAARQLYDALLSLPWKQAAEDEALGLLTQLSDAEQPAQRLAAHVAALGQLTDRMVQARMEDRMRAVEHPEKLPRPQLQAKQQDNRRWAREGYADRLRRQAAAHPGPLARWMEIERLYLDVTAGRNLDQAAETCWEALGAAPTAGEPDDDAAQLNEWLRHRYLLTVMNLAARRGAQPALADRVLKYLEAGAKADPEDPRWNVLQYQLLVALDRPKDLARRLGEWIAAGDADNGWRVTLGYLHAESGRLDEAIRVFEAVRAADELRSQDSRTLADWYMATNRREAYDRARIDAFKTMEEYRLNQWLYAKLRPWQRYDGEQQPPPRELDVEVLLAFTAIFEKSSQPQNYLGQLGQFYGATRDFRLLAGLGDAVVGHAAGRVYPFLQGMSGVLAEVRDEATADSIEQRISAARSRAKTDVDRRALDLLEMLVLRRAAELKNQPGPHAARALAAMKRAWKHAWSPGEPRLVADLLASLGGVPDHELAAEQLRELESLYREAPPGSADRMAIGYSVAQANWAHRRHDRAIDQLTQTLAEYQAACGGTLPTTANDALGTLVGYLENRTHHARGEQLLAEQLKHPANRQQTSWLVQRLYQLYDSALANDGEVSLGRGPELFRAVDKRLQEELDSPDQNHRYHLVSRLVAIYRTARSKKLPGVADAARRFAFDRLPKVVTRQTNNYTSMVAETANMLHDVAEAKLSLEFLIRRIQNEPAWFRLNNQDGWSQYSYQLTQWRSEVKNLGPLDLPLLDLVTAELRRDLHSRQERDRAMYRKHSGRFWTEKEADFADTAEEVWAQDKRSGAACTYIAEYLFAGLEHRARAIEILLDAHRREVLDETGQSRLITYLHHQQQFAESIPLLEPLVQRRPDQLLYRVWLMHAYFRTAQPQRLAELLKTTHDHFHQQGRWHEEAMATLGRSCLENALYQTAAGYLAEAIAIRQRTAPRRGIDDGVLSGYYGDQARAYAGMKRTGEAVDAASAAVVAWGRHFEHRAQALQYLQTVLRDAADLDQYVAALDKKAAATGQENPVVRKAIGNVYLDKAQYARAVSQLRIAAEVQPADVETHQAIMACFEQQKDQRGAVEELLRWRETAARDIKLYEDLGKRLETLGDVAEAERAYTSIVEVLPAESESHQLLAEIRQRQQRWSDATVQWEQVARLRSLEPTGLVGWAGALISQGRKAEAAEVLRRLKQKAWPARFEGPPENLPERIRSLEEKLNR